MLHDTSLLGMRVEYMASLHIYIYASFSLQLFQRFDNERKHLFGAFTPPEPLLARVTRANVAEECFLAPDTANVQYPDRHAIFLGPLDQSPRGIRRQTAAHHQNTTCFVDSLLRCLLDYQWYRLPKHNDCWFEYATRRGREPRALLVNLHSRSASVR